MSRVSAVLVRALLEVVERHSVSRASREALLEGSSLTATQLEEPGARVELTQLCALQRRALALTGDAALGLHVAERASEAAFDLVGHLVSHAPTLREAVTLCSQFLPLFMDDARVAFSVRGATARLRCDFVRSDPGLDTWLAELATAGLLRMLTSFAGAHARPYVVYFEHARPAYHREYARVFSGAERFAQPFTGIDFAAALLDHPHLHRHAELHAVLRTEAERALDRLTTSATYTERLQQHFRLRSAARLPDMKTAARELGLCERSLRRKLTDEGTSYRQLVDAELASAAKRLLREPQGSVQHAAYTLGFDASAFHRAFKRWTGVTPHQYLEQPR